MATPYAFATLVTSDSYLPGALALVAALKELHPSPPTAPEVDFQTVCLVTPETVDVASIKLLRKTYNVVIGVEIIEQEDDKNLRLLGRPDLNTVLTKLHIFRLTQYSKIIFLDADVLPFRPMSHLLTLPHEFSAVPDVGWPDIFNSGVLVLTPGEEKFNELMQLQKTKGSWDGGDQGLFNEWRGTKWNRLSFVYNTTPTAAYTYAPAYERFGAGITAVHFIGSSKPWNSLQWRAPGTKSSEVTMNDGTKRVYNYEALVDRWYDVYDRHYRSEALSAPAQFQVASYTSAWNDGTGLGAELRAMTSAHRTPGGALDLEELKKAAIQGLSVLSKVGATGRPTGLQSDGEYLSMPLEGRVDLMRPRKKPEAVPQPTKEQHQDRDDGSNQPQHSRPAHIRVPSPIRRQLRADTLSTPGPNEIPSTPYMHGHSLPPTASPTPYYGPLRQSQPSWKLEQDRGALFLPDQYVQAENGYDSQEWQQSQHYPYVPALYEQRLWHPSESSEDEAVSPPQTKLPPYLAAVYQHQHQHHRHQARSSGLGQQTQQGEIRQEERYQHHKEGRYAEQPPSGARTPTQHRRRADSRNTQPHVSREHRSDRRLSISGQQTPTQAHYSPSGVRTPKRQSSPHQPRAHHRHQGGHDESVHYQTLPAQHHSSPPNEPAQTPQARHYRAQAQQHYQQQYQNQQLQTDSAPPRAASPPKLSWNPALEPPPKQPPSLSALPQDTYFPNIWDQSPSQQHDATYQVFPSPNPSDVFFHPPPPSNIPEQLIKEGRYSNVIGNIPLEGSLVDPIPDRNKVHAVFPWEEKPRHVPHRVFPKTDSPPPVANYIESERTSSPVATSSPTERLAPPPHIHSSSLPLRLPLSVAYHNAWDTVPSIQKYASKLAGSPTIFPHQLTVQPAPAPEEDWRKGWERQKQMQMEERHDASEDGDDEDEGESESEGGMSDVSSGGSVERMRLKARLKKKEYRTRGVQATPQTAEKGIQCTIVDDSDFSYANIGTNPAILAEVIPVGLGITQQLSENIVPGLLPSAVPRVFEEHQQRANRSLSTEPYSADVPFPSMVTPRAIKPRGTMIFESSQTHSPPTVPSPKVTSPPRIVTSSLSMPEPANLPPHTGPTPPPPTLQNPRLVQFTNSQARQTTSLHGAVSPRSGIVSPRINSSPRRGSTSSLPIGSSKVLGSSSPIARMQQTPSPKINRPSSLSSPFAPQLVRSTSMESATSPATTIESLATPENTPVERVRRGSRVWDPTRGVDVFKRGSEEVLARFLRMGSFEDDENKKQPL